MVSLLDAWATISTVRTAPGSFAISSGSNRIFVGISWTRGAPTLSNPTTAISLGGQALTRVNQEQTTAGADLDTAIWILEESKIAARSNDNFSITPSVTGSFNLIGAVYEDVDQVEALLTGNLFSDSASSGANPPSAALPVQNGAMAIAALLANQSAASPDASYSNMTERIEVNPASGYISIADAAITSGSTFTPGTTLTHNQVGHIQAIALQPVVVAASATGNAVSGGSATAIGPLEAIGNAVSGGSANADVLADASAVGAAVSGGLANAVALVPGATVSDAVSGGSANAQANVLAQATETITSGGTANASEFTGARAVGNAVSGGSANASAPIPIIPALSVDVSFLRAQRPVVLVDLLLPSLELNIWTLSNVGVFAQKEYQPLAGITSGITIRNSLDENISDASIQLSGQSQELLNIALTEKYQGARANIFLANRNADGEIEAVETIFPGFITNMLVTDDDKESIVSIEIESVFRNVARPEIIRQNASDLQQVSPGDTFFDFTSDVVEPTFG